MIVPFNDTKYRKNSTNITRTPTLLPIVNQVSVSPVSNLSSINKNSDIKLFANVKPSLD